MTEFLALPSTIACRSKGKDAGEEVDHAVFHTSADVCHVSSRQRRDETGSVRGAEGPLTIPLPAVGGFVDEGLGWKIHRISEEAMLIVDNLQPNPSKGVWKQFITMAHGVLLKRLGKDRVVYVLRETREVGGQIEQVWRSSINLVAGVSCVWLDEFPPGDAVMANYCKPGRMSVKKQ